jgi:hypothetical protein
MPVGETTELYKMEFWTDSFAALKRTKEQSSKTFAYTKAEQESDFVTHTDTIYIKAYQWSPVMGWGHPLIETIFVDSRTQADNYDDVLLALSPASYWKLDGTGTSQTDAGSLANTATCSGSPSYSQPGMLLGNYGSSIYFPSSSYMQAPYVATYAWSNYVSVSVIVRPEKLSGYLWHLGRFDNISWYGLAVSVGSTGKLSVTYNYYSTADTKTTAEDIIVADEKVHLVFVFTSVQMKVYKNSVLVSTLALNN